MPATAAPREDVVERLPGEVWERRAGNGQNGSPFDPSGSSPVQAVGARGQRGWRNVRAARPVCLAGMRAELIKRIHGVLSHQ